MTPPAPAEAGWRVRLVFLIGLACAWCTPAGPAAGSPPASPRLPRITPDYVEVVLPPNLAPPNFRIREDGTEYQLRVAGPRAQPLLLRQATPDVRLPPREWKELLRANRGDSLRWHISVRDPSGEWVSLAPFGTTVAGEDIDPYVFYRRLQPLYSTHKHLGIYQRHLESFEEKPVLRNDRIDHGCVNCHTPFRGSTNRFAISFRGRFGTPTLLIDSNRISRIDVKMGYLAWHPDGKLLAFATNSITQFFHLAGSINRDTHDAGSGINLYDLDTTRIEPIPALDAADRDENWPAWGPDGRHLYYSSAPKVEVRGVAGLRCDLFRVSYDPERRTWGQPEMLVSSATHRLSANQPRPAPDGRHLVFTGSDHGSFPLFYPDSDLFLLRLNTGEIERLPINSDHAETYHSWSANGRWLLFVSRGVDGVFARLMLTYFDAGGRFSKPLLLPQEDPGYYDTCLHNFNAPEFGPGPMLVSEDDIVRVLKPSANQPPPAATDRAPLYSRE